MNRSKTEHQNDTDCVRLCAWNHSCTTPCSAVTADQTNVWRRKAARITPLDTLELGV